jgi:hypothetical protein
VRARVCVSVNYINACEFAVLQGIGSSPFHLK